MKRLIQSAITFLIVAPILRHVDDWDAQLCAFANDTEDES